MAKGCAGPCRAQHMTNGAHGRTGQTRSAFCALPMRPGSRIWCRCEFDCAICQFGVMFFADKRAAFHETFRVLKQGGRFLFIVWDREVEIGIRSVAAEVMGRVLSRDPASLLPPPYFDLTAARADLEAAGFGAVSIEKLPERSRAKSPQEAAIANCHGGILRTHIEQHAPGRLEEITNAVADALAEKFGAGPIDAPMQAILFTASR